MARSLPIKTRLLIAGAWSVLAVIVPAGAGLLGLYMIALAASEAQILPVAIQTELRTAVAQAAVEADVIRAVLLGPHGVAGDVTALQAKLRADAGNLRSAVAELGGLTLPDLAGVAAKAVLPLAEAYLTSAEATAAVGLQDDAAGRAALPDFTMKRNGLAAELGKLGAAVRALDVQAATANAARVRLWATALLAASVGAVLMASFSAIKVRRSVTQPLERLRGALAQVADGALAIKIGQITRDDDIGAIARDIDRVSDRVEATVAQNARLQADVSLMIAGLGDGLRNLATGNLSHRIDAAFSADHDPLRQDFNTSVDQLSRMIGQVVAASESIRARSVDIGRAAEDLASRTETQAATLEETAAALQQMTASVTSAAESAKEVEAVVLKARHDVEESGRVVQGAVTAMNEIEASSTQISQIIGVIDDIAFQTNLLALNAGVEAARAGDAGRGFAVVASEVRALAQRSSVAAKEIKVLISASSGHVHSGVQQVDSAGRSLSSVVHQVAQISRLVSNIAAGSLEQAHGLTEINIGVAQLDQVTQHNAAMVEQSGTATQALSHEAAGLSALVSQFAIAKDRARPNPAAHWRPTVAMAPDIYPRSA